MGNLIQDLKDAAAARAALSKDLWAAARGIDEDSAPTLIAEVERACAPYDRLRKRRGMASLGLAGSPDASMADLLPASVLADARQTLREAVGRLIAYEEERADPAQLSERARKRRDKLVQRVTSEPTRPSQHYVLIQLIALVGRAVTGQDPGYTRNAYKDTNEGPWIRFIRTAVEYFSGECVSESVISRELWALRRRRWKLSLLTGRCRPRAHAWPLLTRTYALPAEAELDGLDETGRASKRQAKPE